VSLDQHRGKGAAVRAGVLRSTGRSVVFLDADLAYSPEDVVQLLERVEAGCDVAVGTRRHHYVVSEGRARPIRRASSRAFSALTGALLLGEQRDTQCGIKAFDAAAARSIFERSRVDGFAFDVEIFVIVRELGLNLAEVAVGPSYTSRSSVRLGRHAPEMVRDLLRVRMRAARGAYRRGSAPGS
jgi:dolichyl-phosphate beta-glucosyltransferase